MIFGNMGEMMRMAKEMQSKFKQVKDELAKEVFEGKAQGVTVKISGDMELKDVKIDPQAANTADVTQMEKAVKEAIQRSLKSARDGAAKKMKGITGGLGLPGMF